MKQSIKVYRDLMGANAEWAERSRSLLGKMGIRMLNFIGSPGSGKTSLLEATIKALGQDIRMAILEGDVETTYDAERLQPLGIPVSQLLTGGACHLEAKLVHTALQDLPLKELDLVMIENVGNLVCPAEFDIGENMKIAVLSITEGEEKALKYPLLFREAQIVLLTKLDLLPHLPFDLERCLAAIHQINALCPIFTLSTLNGSGVSEWTKWLKGFIHRS